MKNEQGFISGKTQRMINETIKYIRDNPEQTIHTNSQMIKDRILSLLPDAKVEVVKEVESW